MHPLLFEVFGFKVFTYGLAMVTAFAVCLFLTFKSRQHHLLTVMDIYNLALLGMATLLFATKLKEILIRGDFSLLALKNLLTFWSPGSFEFWPSFLLAPVQAYIYCHKKKISTLVVMDELLPIAILGVAIHRIFGCFMAGCCYGKPTDLPWGIIFNENSRAGENCPGISLHPTQLYYGLSAAIIYFFLLWYKRRHAQPGIISALSIMMMSFSYFIITFLRGDIPIAQRVFFLSFSQYIALIIFIAGSIFYIFQTKHVGGNMKQVITISFFSATIMLLSLLVAIPNPYSASNQIIEDKIPGFDDKPDPIDKIPGFDDRIILETIARNTHNRDKKIFSLP